MKFEINPQLIVTAGERNTLERARLLCDEMDKATTFNDDDDIEEAGGCEICPLKKRCSQMANECVFVVAKNALEKIIDAVTIE